MRLVSVMCDGVRGDVVLEWLFVGVGGSWCIWSSCRDNGSMGGVVGVALVEVMGWLHVCMCRDLEVCRRRRREAVVVVQSLCWRTRQ
jgi:hypothetical protein